MNFSSYFLSTFMNYGINEVINMDDFKVSLKNNAPSYEELYNYWLETKQK